MIEVPSELPTRWAFTGSGLDAPVIDSLSISALDAGEGRVSMPIGEYLVNSFGAVQGGVMALLGEVAGAGACGARGRGPVVVGDLQVVYLALGRVGPIVSRTTVLDAGAGGSGQSAVVEFDRPGRGWAADHRDQRRGGAGPPGSRRHRLMSTLRPGEPVDPPQHVSQYFRLQRWEIPPTHEGPSELVGRSPLDDHQRGAGGGLFTGGLLTAVDSIGGMLAGLSVQPDWVDDHLDDGHRRPALPEWAAKAARPGTAPWTQRGGHRGGGGR